MPSAMPIDLPTRVLQEPIVKHIRTDYPRLRPDMTVDQALRKIRQEGLGEKIIYFYVLDDDRHVVGVSFDHRGDPVNRHQRPRPSLDADQKRGRQA